MSTGKDNKSESATLNIVSRGVPVVLNPTKFSGSSSQVRIDDEPQTVYLVIKYVPALVTPGKHSLNHTQFRIEFLDPAGPPLFNHVTAGTLDVTVVGNTHNGTLTGVVVTTSGSGTPDTARISGDYHIVVD